MADLVFYINNVVAPPPDNWQELEIELDFTNNSNDATIRASVLEWKGDNAAIINQWVNGGIKGGVGIFEGIPFQIQACNGITVFDGCIDTTSPETTFTCDIVKAAIKETQRAYFLNDVAQGFTFAYLEDAQSKNTGAAGFTPINPSTDYVSVPYVLSNVPDYFSGILISITLVQVISLIGNGVGTGGFWSHLTILYEKLIADIAYAAALIASSILSPAGIAYSVIVVLYDTLMLVLYITYIVLVLSSIFSLLIALIECFIPQIRYKYGIKVFTLFQKACAYLGYNFSSSILQTDPYNNLVLIPKKQAFIYNNQKNDTLTQIFSSINLSFSGTRKQYDDAINFNQNVNVHGYYDGTFTQLIMDMEKVFNAKIAIKNVAGVNTLHFERWDFFNNQAAYTLPDVSTEAPFDNPYGTNANEIASNYLVKWTLDSSDLNTYDIYDGTSCQMQMLPKTISNTNNLLLKNLTDVLIPFALAKRKDINRTFVEKMIITIYNYIFTPAYNLLRVLVTIASFGAVSLPSAPTYTYNSRQGCMLLSGDFTSVPKLLVGVNTGSSDINGIPIYSIDPNNNIGQKFLGYLDAYTLMKNFHSASLAVDTFDLNKITYPNQYLTYKDNEIPLCCSDFTLLKNNNIVNTFDGKKGRLDSLRWNPHFETAKIDYRVNQTYTTNLNQTFIIDGQ